MITYYLVETGTENFFELPQGSIPGHLLFNIFLINLFFIIEDYDITSYVDDNTPCVCESNISC